VVSKKDLGKQVAIAALENDGKNGFLPLNPPTLR